MWVRVELTMLGQLRALASLEAQLHPVLGRSRDQWNFSGMATRRSSSDSPRKEGGGHRLCPMARGPPCHCLGELPGEAGVFEAARPGAELDDHRLAWGYMGRRPFWRPKSRGSLASQGCGATFTGEPTPASADCMVGVPAGRSPANQQIGEGVLPSVGRSSHIERSPQHKVAWSIVRSARRSVGRSELGRQIARSPTLPTACQPCPTCILQLG
jgi:hypothetical protein